MGAFMGKNKRIVGVLVTFLMVLTVGANEAQADTNGWLTPSTSWSQYNGNMSVYGESYYNNWGAWGKDYAKATDLYFRASKNSGSGVSSATRVKGAVSFGGVGIEVSVSYPAGVSAGFVDIGSTCDHGYWDGNATYVSVDFGSGTICDTSTWGWVSNVSLTITGGSRFGGSWSVRTATRNRDLGGL